VDQAARTIVEHDVADENQTDGFGARASGEDCPRYAEQDDQQAQAASPTHRAGPLLETIRTSIAARHRGSAHRPG
jgi:hypothetical protein